MKLHVVLLGALVACGGDDGSGRLADAPAAHIIVEPADLTVTITNDAVVMQPYTAHLVGDKGLDVDVTAETTFTLKDAAYGTFDGATLSVTGMGAGPTRVQASARGSTGDAGLTVMVKKVIVDPSGPSDPASLFAAATEDPARAPSIAYPLDKILVPPNLGQFDVHWKNGALTNDLFEITMANAFVDVRLYTKGLDATNTPFWTVFAPETWYPIASSRQQLTLKVAGLDTAAPATKGTAGAQKVDVTNENSQGGIYYWTSSQPAGVWRYDISKPNVAPAPFWADNAPAGCMGCHTLSRDGKRMAITLDFAGGRGAVYTVADKAGLNTPTAQSWNFATFNAAADKLVTIENGKMLLRAVDGTKLLADPLPTVTANASSTHPELSPDDKFLVNSEFTSGNDFQAQLGSIVIRTFDNATNTFGAPTTLVPYVAADGFGNYYPSFSPDGKWVAYTRTRSVSYDDVTAENWLVKADGTKPPIQLAITNLTGNLTNSWARWVPFAQTYGAQNEPMFYLTFSSRREFGVRIPGGGRPQIWMTPIFPARAEAGMDPSGNAFRVPFQNVTTSNHIAQWTQSIQ